MQSHEQLGYPKASRDDGLMRLEALKLNEMLQVPYVRSVPRPSKAIVLAMALVTDGLAR